MSLIETPTPFWLKKWLAMVHSFNSDNFLSFCTVKTYEASCFSWSSLIQLPPNTSGLIVGQEYFGEFERNFIYPCTSVNDYERSLYLQHPLE